MKTKQQEKQIVSWEDVYRKDGYYITAVIPATTAQTATNYSVIFAPFWPSEVIGVTECHDVAGTDAGDVTLQIERLQPGVASGSGEAMLVTGFNLKSTANTVVMKSGKDLVTTRSATDGVPYRQLYEGDRLGLKVSGTLTALDQVVVTVYLKQLGRGDYR